MTTSLSDKPTVVGLTHLPPEPQAGKTFVVVVELDREVVATDGDVAVSLEKQRIVPADGGFPETRPTGSKYFELGFEPAPVTIAAGGRFGISLPMVVKKDATAEEGEVPVSFPEKLLITAFINDLGGGFRSDLMYVQARTTSPAAFLFAADDLTLGQHVPAGAERDVVGAATSRIVRGSAEFLALIENRNPDIVFKDEEGTGADRRMTKKVQEKLDRLAASVKSEWPGLKLRITEGWDENIEHGPNSVHYEARGVDLTTSDVDGAKLGRLGRLAVNAGFEWVFYEDSTHIHASMSK